MVNKPKAIGTSAETAVCRYLKGEGFRAKRLTLHGSSDVGDIDCGFDEICIEVKGGRAAENASDGRVAAWLAETETERTNAVADIGILVLKRKGIGAANAGKWWAVMTGLDFQLLLAPGYPRDFTFTAPVRLHLDSVVSLLRKLA